MPHCNAFSNHAVASVEGRWKPCCRFRDFATKMLVEDFTLIQYKESEYFQNIVNTMKDGWHSGCEKCQLDESINKKSLRQKMNEELSGKGGIEYIELSLSKQCNLHCRMCNPAFSSAWGDLIKRNPEISNIIYEGDNVNLSLENVFKDLDMTKLIKIKYLGGEPFITTEIKDLFELLDKEGIIENIELEIASNCTLFPKKLVKYLKRFRKLNLFLSIDGIGNINEYIRDGKTWNDIIINVEEWKKYRSNHNNIEIFSLTTVQAYNLHQISKLKDFAKDHDINFQTHLLWGPKYLSIHALPIEYLQKIKDNENSSWVDIAKFNPLLFEEFKKFTLLLDTVMKKDIKDVIPDLYKYF
jgi:organic radical activating enzyme